MSPGRTVLAHFTMRERGYAQGLEHSRSRNLIGDGYRRAIREQYNTHVFVDGQLVPRVSGSGFGTFKTWIQPFVEEHSDDEDDMETSIKNTK
jgi:hypothetical protein